ncbi:MAG: hypothetical protein EFT35_07735 [Methanophagales archaeon ANME-1-THS]|nr:MAG: hypothetical protein EFT35_07735 [Methanophagales archaeon ANME-1-THS]
MNTNFQSNVLRIEMRKDSWTKDKYNHLNETIVRILFAQPTWVYPPRASELRMVIKDLQKIHGSDWLRDEIGIKNLS